MLNALSVTRELGRVETFFSDVIYPAWPFWMAAALVATAAAGVAAYRLGWLQQALRHKLLAAVGIGMIVGVSAYPAWYAVSPLFDRSTVCEASPITGTGAGSEKCEDVALAATMPPTVSPAPSASASHAASATPATAFEPREITRGSFVSGDDFHFAHGEALLIETAPGKYTLRFENFSVRNGPDVFVLLSPAEGYTAEALNLGSLKGTDGAFNYEVPAGTDTMQYRAAVIWCRQFDVLFGHATFA